jgi:hypothetical protein
MDKLDDILRKLDLLVIEEEKRKTFEERREKKKQDFLNHEEPKLKQRSWFVFAVLSLFIIVSGSLTACRNFLGINLVWACIIAGILGSTTSALISALDRTANGWESKDGDKYPATGKPDKFSLRMSTFFFFRPLFGILAGLLIFYGIYSNYFGCSEVKNENGFIFISFLAGLFIKSLIEKLKDLFDNLVGK